MDAEKKYYWIKLKTDFMTSDKVDYLMSQTNGSEYVVLYQMLCMKCINTDGLLARQIGEVIIPFDAEKITRDCKYFSIDTVKMAFQLFIQLGMIYQESNGYLRITDFENMVGSSKTDDHTKKLNAERQAKFRENHKNKELIYGEPVTVTDSNNVTVTDDVTLKRNAESRDKILDIDISTLSLGQQNYAKQVYEIWKENGLPCSKDFIYFIQNEFKSALDKIKGIHSNDVIQACKNYIQVLKDDDCYVSNKYWFDSFVSSKTFRDYLPNYFDIAKFKRYQNRYENQNDYKQSQIKQDLQNKKDSGYMLEVE